MRIVAIGLGGAGCRIVDSLYSADRKSSRIACIQALAVDVDENTITHLKNLPDTNKLCYPTIDTALPGPPGVSEPSTAIDIAEIIARIHNFESGETDALFICMGLGGTLADIAPHIISGLRSSTEDMIFGLVTLPCLAEGEKRSAQAADQIDILSSLLDGVILFDNETWYKKTKSQKTAHVKKEKGLAQMLGLGKPEPELSPEMSTYALLNEGIVRRISLILKAGEFNSDGGIDLAEVVLDSGEVINTMKGMGFITIGYAVERLPNNPLAFLSQFRPQGVFDEENKKKASRIVDLAKQAIYHEISTPCDMTSAHKALVLIAGPSHELSMKGFMTVRKWIDRSIAGLETRSGDYPVVNTKNVAIIVMLSGLENIPRVSELRDIREQYRAWSERRIPAGDGAIDGLSENDVYPAGPAAIRDQMIVLPARMKKTEEPVSLTPGESVVIPRGEGTQAGKHAKAHRHNELSEKKQQPVDMISPGDTDDDVSQPLQEQPGTRLSEVSPGSARHRVVVAGTAERPGHHPAPAYSQKQTDTPITPTPSSLQPRRYKEEIPGISPVRVPAAGDKDAARQRIELELQRQRLKAMSGRVKTTNIPAPVHETDLPEPTRKPAEIRARPVIRSTRGDTGIPPVPAEEQKTVIIPKRKVIARSQETLPEKAMPELQHDKPDTELPAATSYTDSSNNEVEISIDIRDTPYRAKDQVFSGREVQKPKTSLTRDTPLIHTRLKPKKTAPDPNPRSENPTADPPDTEEPTDTPIKKAEKKGRNQDDLSWI